MQKSFSSSKQKYDILLTPSDNNSKPLRLTTPRGSRQQLESSNSINDLSRLNGSVNRESPLFVKKLTSRDATSLRKSYRFVKIGEGAHRLEFNLEYYKQLYKDSLTENDILLIKKVFDTYDSNGNGTLTPSDIKNILHDNNKFMATKDTLYDIIGEYDDDESGGISIDEFMRLMSKSVTPKEKKPEIEVIFKQFCGEGKNEIDFEALKRVVSECGEEIDEEELMEIMLRSDSNGDGKLSFNDFYNIMTKNVY